VGKESHPCHANVAVQDLTPGVPLCQLCDWTGDACAAATDMAGAAITGRPSCSLFVPRGKRVNTTRGHTGETGFPP
jgi:hypothetical protein